MNEEQRDKMNRYPGCPHAWCYCSEQCQTVGLCLQAKYEKEGQGHAAIRVQHRDDSKSAGT